jgi:hypothetical protein
MINLPTRNATKICTELTILKVMFPAVIAGLASHKSLKSFGSNLKLLKRVFILVDLVAEIRLMASYCYHFKGLRKESIVFIDPNNAFSSPTAFYKIGWEAYQHSKLLFNHVIDELISI